MPVDPKDITFCVKTFNRPNLLFRCLNSLIYFSPESKIVVVDDSTIPYDYPADLLPHIQLVRTEPNIGLSAGRNNAVSQVTTPFCFVLDDDHGLQKRSHWAESLRSVDDKWTDGIVGWPLREGSHIHCGYEWVIQDDQRGRCVVSIPSTGRCDLVLNNFLAPTDTLKKNPWPEHLKMGEHFTWFWKMTQQANTVSVYALPHKYAWLHMTHPESKNKQYVVNRNISRAVQSESLKQLGISRCYWVRRIGVEIGQPVSGYCPLKERLQSKEGLPNVILIGIGHTNSSITVKQMLELGWNSNDLDDEYGESESVRSINHEYLKTGLLSKGALVSAITSLKPPWVIKDPALTRRRKGLSVFELSRGELLQFNPLLVWLDKDRESVKASYAKREESLNNLDSRYECCEDVFESWTGSKVKLKAEDLARAFLLFRNQSE